MDLNTALSMEVLEMERMKKKVSPNSSFVETGILGSPSSENQDLISFNDAPTTPSSKPSWEFFEQSHQALIASSAGGRSNSLTDFSRLYQSTLRTETETTLIENSSPFKRSSSYKSFPANYADSSSLAYKSATLSQQGQVSSRQGLQLSTVNPFRMSATAQPMYAPYSVIHHHVTSLHMRSQTPPPNFNAGPSANNSMTLFPDSPLFATNYSGQSHLSKSWDRGSLKEAMTTVQQSQNPILGSATTSDSKNNAQEDEINNVFQRWLNTENENSPDGFPDKNGKSVAQPASDWKEWDPLHEPQDVLVNFAEKENTPPTTVGGTGKNPMNSQKQEETVETPNMEISVQSDLRCSTKTDFLNMVLQVRNTFPSNDPLSNPGYLISPMMPKWQATDDDAEDNTLKISITTEDSHSPIVFTCNINASVEHVLSQALCIVYEDVSEITASNYRFKVQGKQEFLLSGTVLSLYELVQDCIKFEEDVHLQLLHHASVDKSLIRTSADDHEESLLEQLNKGLEKNTSQITSGNVGIVKAAFLGELEKLGRQHVLQSNLTISQQCDRIMQCVKAVCQLFGGMETIDITQSMLKLRQTVDRTSDSSSDSRQQQVFNIDGSTAPKPTSAILVSSDSKLTEQEQIEQAAEQLTTSVCNLVDMFCEAMELDVSTNRPALPTDISCNVHDLVTVNLVSAHRLPHMWATMYDEYYLTCELCYGDRQLCPRVQTKVIKSTKSYHAGITWNVWQTFPVKVSDLPRESKLCLTLHGYPMMKNETAKPEKINSKELCWVNIPMFNHKNVLYQGGSLHGTWSAAGIQPRDRISAACSSNIANNDSVVVNIQLLSTQHGKSVMFPPYSLRLLSSRRVTSGHSMSSLDESTQQDLMNILNKNPFSKLSDHEEDLLWKHRHVKELVCTDGSLARILRCAPSWTPRNLSTIYNLLESWPKIKPIEAFELLSVSFPDHYVRLFAIRCIQQGEEDEIHDYLVQLTHALKYERFHDSTLARFLLRSALGSIRICHKLYWLLSENISGGHASERYRMMLNALEATAGSKLKKEFEKEAYLVKLINRVAEAVKYAKDSSRPVILEAELEKVASRVKKHLFRLPTNPSLVSNGIDVENSSYFTSNAMPLRLAFCNADAQATPKFLQLMYKVGDDLRQDVLTMQLVRIMDKLWLAEGLDLKMITFACLSTGKDRGFIELVSDSTTLREIQSSYGLAGAFKDRPIAEWLQKHNPTSISYEKAEQNFTLSCAGYCVATYVLGICDRHNDNIMLHQSGHIFHIDFAKFLGHAQMFGNIKRDRAPFVLTSDMAYVINGGDRPSSRFHDFVDICCRAFNIIRRNAHMFINLLSLMIHSGIPELKHSSDLKYVYDALKPGASEVEATAMFTRLIETSLRSSFTRINFFIHNLAQLRFHGSDSEDKKSLSFAPKVYTSAEDGVITSATVVGYQKKYNPEKYYSFCVRLTREMRSGESYVFRTFNEFAELHQKLSLNFPSWKLPSFPNRVIVGRSQIKQVAEKRKSQLTYYLHFLLNKHLDVSNSDLIYSFFHPLLRDEQGNQDRSSVDQTISSRVPGSVGGEIKLSIHHKNGALFTMVMYCRNLVSPDGSDPDPYVKTYLLPDPNRLSKRKTKVAKKTLHPTYNEMLVYEISASDVETHSLYVSVWNYEALNENDFMGSVTLQLHMMDLSKDNTAWYSLTSRILPVR